MTSCLAQCVACNESIVKSADVLPRTHHVDSEFEDEKLATIELLNLLSHHFEMSTFVTLPGLRLQARLIRSF